MPYTCSRCSKSFNQKIHLINHLKKKNLCPPNTCDKLPSILLDELLGDKTSKSSPTNDVIGPTPTILNNGSINIFILPSANTDEYKILSTTDYTDVGSAINSILELIINKNNNSGINIVKELN
jgi:hypothetical protein